jgi:hypothetical protein
MADPLADPLADPWLIIGQRSIQHLIEILCPIHLLSPSPVLHLSTAHGGSCAARALAIKPRSLLVAGTDTAYLNTQCSMH